MNMPSYIDARLGPAETADGRLVVPVHVTVRRRTFGFARLTWSTGRERFPTAPRWRLALATAQICLRPGERQHGRSAGL